MMALEGVRVLDLSRLAPGPFCTMLLADFGADVIVVEAPPGAARIGEPERAEVRALNPLQRNKRSIAINLRHPEGREAFYRLARSADVVVEGFRPGVVKRLGVDYETLSRLNPRLVYCSLSGYGQNGPYAPLVGHDINYISVGGALGLTGWPGQPPAIPMNIIADFAGGGLYAAFAICLALLARERTGRGQYIDMAMSDGVTSLLTWVASRYLATGQVPRPGEDMLNGGVPFYNVYRCADGRYISIGCLEPYFWEALCRALGAEEFIPHQWDRQRYPEMFEFFRRRFQERTRDEWFQELRQHEVCVAPVYSLDEVFADPHVRQRGMLVELQDPEAGTVRQVGIGPKLSDTPGSIRTLGPRLGEHTDQVLREAGYSEAEVAALRQAGAVA
ncbi:MAG TPA: CaiB/BaiF CoA-transferase family protein [Dehalococcoidia bacterium]|nr:CaiB/BaiF CoA-transferase family protein [Dehalococcoidia bacterium]